MPKGIGYRIANTIKRKAMPKRKGIKTGRRRPRISVALRGRRRKF